MKIDELIGIDTIIISGNNEISENTAFRLLASILASTPRFETMQHARWIENSYKFFQTFGTKFKHSKFTLFSDKNFFIRKLYMKWPKVLKG